MIIRTKFDIGQIVYVPKSCDNPAIPCPLCRGEKILTLQDGRKLACGKCFNTGEVPGPAKYAVHPFRIGSLYNSVHANGTVAVTYRMDEARDPAGRWKAAPHENHVEETGDIFATHVEAEEAARRLEREAQEWHESSNPWEILDPGEVAALSGGA